MTEVSESAGTAENSVARLSESPRSTARIAGRPIHSMLVPIPIVCFAGTLLTEIVYWRTADMMWSNMSAWLLAAGLVAALFAVLAGVADFIGDRHIRAMRPAWKEPQSYSTKS